MWAPLVKLVIQIAAGVGFGKVLDIFGRKSVPTYPVDPILPTKQINLVWLIALLSVSVFIVRFIGRSMKINILK